MNQAALTNQRLVRFQGFELDLQTGELSKAGTRVRLQDQPLKVLTALVQRPGELVTRDELAQIIWPEGGFGDVDHAINLAVTKLRGSLGDSADVPHLIETLPRRGYRFIGAVERDDAGTKLEESTAPPDAHPKPSATARKYAIPLLGLVAATGILFIFWRKATTPLPVPHVISSAQITKDRLPKSHATIGLVTDGARLYFQEGSLDSSEQNTALVQIALHGGETARIPISLRSPVAYDFSQSNSQLLFGAGEFGPAQGERPLWALPLPAGPPHRVGDIIAADAAWAPDGHRLVFANGNSIFVAASDGSQIRKLLTAEGFDAAFYMRFSPDGTRLRFTAARFPKSGDEADSRDVMEVAADGSGLHTLPIHGGCCGTWSEDGNYFFYHKGRDTWVLPERHSWFGGIKLEEPVQLTAGPIAYDAPTPGPTGKDLFLIGHQERIELVHHPNDEKGWEPFLGGISAGELEVSPDGQWVVYSTFPEFNLWRSKLDGTERLQLTFSPVNAHEPHWSPDGKQILYTDFPFRLFVISANGGAPTQLMPSDHPDLIGAADWLPDGNSIIFGRRMGCSDTSCLSIFQLDLKTRGISKIPGSDHRIAARLSNDGRYIAALSLNQSRNCVMLFDFQTQKWTKLADAFGSMVWSRDSKSIFMTLKHDKDPSELIRISVPSGRVQHVLDLKGVTLGGLWPDWVSLLPDDSPVLMFDRSSEEIYRLDLQYP